MPTTPAPRSTNPCFQPSFRSVGTRPTATPARARTHPPLVTTGEGETIVARRRKELVLRARHRERHFGRSLAAHDSGGLAHRGPPGGTRVGVLEQHDPARGG